MKFTKIRPFIISFAKQYQFDITAANFHTITQRQLAQMASEYRLKLADGLSADTIKNGQKFEVEVEGVDEGKLLLLKVNDELRAMNRKCTHYGAPLVKGVVTGDGRLTCPWHGACFNTTTGDIENAPALDHLNVFPVQLKKGDIYITGTAEKIKAFSRVPGIKCRPADTAEHVVVVGGGSGAIGAIESLREKGFSGRITCISKEPHLPFDRTKLSKTLMADLAKLQWRDSQYFKDAGVNFELESTVQDVDFDTKKVYFRRGGTTQVIEYGKLILATGGTPKRLPMDGFDLSNVLTLRGLDDVKAILSESGEGKKVVVVGSSFIGMEVGNCLAGKKNDVTIIGMESAPLERVMGAKVGKIFQRLLVKNGVKFKMDSSIDKALPSASNSKRVGAILLKNGETVDADVVILGVGVSPETSFIKDSSLLLEDKSFEVDDHWRVKGLQDVYAIGDIATYPYKGPGMTSPSNVRIEHWNVAQDAGRLVGAHIATGEHPTPFIPIFWSAMGAQLRYCGNISPHGYDELVLIGNPDEAKFVAYYCKGETVVAVASMQKDPYMSQSAELMRRGGMPTKSELKAGKDILGVDVTAQVVI